MKKIVCLTIALVLATSGVAFAQSAASNKAFFGKSYNEITIAAVSGKGYSDPVTLFDISEALKTSNVGAVSAILSMEASLWTYNLTTAIVNSGKSSSSSRAAIKAWVEIDGQVMEPGAVVYADRLQATGLTVNLACNVTDVVGNALTCTVSGDITLELFQRTKNANSFVFYLGPLRPKIHSVVVKAQALIECRSNGGVINCPKSTLDAYEDADTMAAIGKATLLVEEHNNWGE